MRAPAWEDASDSFDLVTNVSCCGGGDLIRRLEVGRCSGDDGLDMTGYLFLKSTWGILRAQLNEIRCCCRACGLVLGR